jgi:hypothetical protein
MLLCVECAVVRTGAWSQGPGPEEPRSTWFRRRSDPVVRDAAGGPVAGPGKWWQEPFRIDRMAWIATRRSERAVTSVGVV